ncbi:MAG: hypothetical protein M3Y53_00615 [Thermoproteota archaeon]|nr:hypothetical protein [Thermoproteota archaeon]
MVVIEKKQKATTIGSCGTIGKRRPAALRAGSGTNACTLDRNWDILIFKYN